MATMEERFDTIHGLLVELSRKMKEKGEILTRMTTPPEMKEGTTGSSTSPPAPTSAVTVDDTTTRTTTTPENSTATTTKETLVAVLCTQIHLDAKPLLRDPATTGVNLGKPVPFEVVPSTAEHTLALVGKVFDELPDPGNYVVVEHGMFTKKAPWPPPSSALSGRVTVRSAAESTAAAAPADGAGGEEAHATLLHEIESLCMRCGENSITRLLPTLIPHFLEAPDGVSALASVVPTNCLMKCLNVVDGSTSAVAGYTIGKKPSISHVLDAAVLPTICDEPAFDVEVVFDEESGCRATAGSSLALLQASLPSTVATATPTIFDKPIFTLLSSSGITTITSLLAKCICVGWQPCPSPMLLENLHDCGMLCPMFTSTVVCSMSCSVHFIWKPPWPSHPPNIRCVPGNIMVLSIGSVGSAAISMLSDLCTRASITGHELLQRLGCELTIQRKCGGNYMASLQEECHLEVVNGANLGYQVPGSTISHVIDSFEVWLQCSVNFWCGRITSLCGLRLNKYLTTELHRKHLKFCGRKRLKPWYLENSFRQGCIMVRISMIAAVQCIIRVVLITRRLLQCMRSLLELLGSSTLAVLIFPYLTRLLEHNLVLFKVLMFEMIQWPSPIFMHFARASIRLGLMPWAVLNSWQCFEAGNSMLISIQGYKIWRVKQLEHDGNLVHIENFQPAYMGGYCQLIHPFNFKARSETIFCIFQGAWELFFSTAVNNSEETSSLLHSFAHELGLGIWCSVVDLQLVDVLVERVLEQILSQETQYLPITRGSSAVLLLNELGATPIMKPDGSKLCDSFFHATGEACVNLVYIGLSKCSGVTEEGISSLVARCSHIITIELTCCNLITNTALDSIAAGIAELVSEGVAVVALLRQSGYPSPATGIVVVAAAWLEAAEKVRGRNGGAPNDP